MNKNKEFLIINKLGEIEAHFNILEDAAIYMQRKIDGLHSKQAANLYINGLGLIEYLLVECKNEPQPFNMFGLDYVFKYDYLERKVENKNSNTCAHTQGKCLGENLPKKIEINLNEFIEDGTIDYSILADRLSSVISIDEIATRCSDFFELRDNLYIWEIMLNDMKHNSCLMIDNYFDDIESELNQKVSFLNQENFDFNPSIIASLLCIDCYKYLERLIASIRF